ncbi:helix-turn-helix domain-containing protein [Streptomyces sp. NBC_00490]|uniref:hypothetical protein n=1 Tax=Streptomyces sp. NBC_00490 TaxID=2903657 RepID=UPI002E18672F
MYPTLAQERQMLPHCARARYVWNLAAERRRRSESPTQRGPVREPGVPADARRLLRLTART